MVRETGNKAKKEEEAQSGCGNLWWKAVDNYGREGGNSSAKHLIQMAPDPTRSSDKKEIGQDTRQRGGAPRHKKTEKYTRRTKGDYQSQTGVKKQERLKEKIYIILGTMSRRGSHAQTRRLNREHATGAFPLSSCIGDTPRAGLPPNSVAIVSPVRLIVKSHQEDGDDSFLATT